MNSISQSGWKPEMGNAGDTAPATYTGNKSLMLEEALIFDIGTAGTTGVDLADAPQVGARLGNLERHRDIGLPGLSEPETVRHYTRLSRQNYAIDLGFFPLGSCTMKHNPRLNGGLCRCPSVAASRDRPRCPSSHSRTGALADYIDGHEGRGDVAQGRGAWRIVWHPCHSCGVDRAR
jgi:hypothetical protein